MHQRQTPDNGEGSYEVQIRDTPLGIDGRPATQFTLAQIHEMLKQETQFNLRFKRGAEFVDIKLEPCRLV